MVDDSTHGRFFMFGGDYSPLPAPASQLFVHVDATNGFLGQAAGTTPILNHFTLYQTSQARSAHTLTVDPQEGGRLFVFGGRVPIDNESQPFFTSTQFQDLSNLSTEFVNAPVTGGPAGRAYHTAVYDPFDKSMIVFGGRTSEAMDASSFKGDVWRLDLLKRPPLSVTTPQGANARFNFVVNPNICGAPLEYDLRRSMSVISEVNFGSATPCPPLEASVGPGSLQHWTINGLTACTRYYFAYKVRNHESTAWSAMSNLVSLVTVVNPCPEDLEGAGSLSFELSGPFPNPSSGSVAFHFAIPRSLPGAEYLLTIFDAAGRKVATVDRGIEPGAKTAIWSGTTDQATRVAPGIYFARLTQGRQIRTQTLLIAGH